MKRVWYIVGSIVLVLFGLKVINTYIRTSPGHSNWAGNQTCQPRKIFYPKTKEELIAIVQDAAKNKYRIHAYGSFHSWSDIVCADYLINTDTLNKILSVDKEKMRVRVEAGIKLEDLNKKLAHMNLALENVPDMTAQSIAGITATATHGTGHTGTLSDFIEGVELVTGTGIVRTLSKSENPEQFAAARMSLGALGIVYALTLRCVPLFKVKHTREVTDWPTLSKQYKDLYAKNDFFQFFWNPYTDKAITYSFNKTDDPVTTVANTYLRYKQKLFIGYWTGELWVTLLRWFPHLTPSFIDFFFRASQIRDYVDYGYNILAKSHNYRDEVIYYEEEIGIPIDELPEALKEVKELMLKYQKEGYYVFMWGVLIRFVKAEQDIYLSPAAQRDTAYISITNPTINNNFYREFYERMLKYRGRAHWGKINFLTTEDARKLYGDNFDKFVKVRRELDTQDIFSNPFVERILDPK